MVSTFRPLSWRDLVGESGIQCRQDERIPDRMRRKIAVVRAVGVCRSAVTIGRDGLEFQRPAD